MNNKEIQEFIEIIQSMIDFGEGVLFAKFGKTKGTFTPESVEMLKKTKTYLENINEQ